jgi:fructose-bisphosphate aldolase class II/tagatose 1,6-diphosphate aldolase GatY/KbaY
MIKLGVSKINIGTKLRLSFMNSIKKAIKTHKVIAPEDVLDLAEEELKKLIQEKMTLFGCTNYAYQ